MFTSSTSTPLSGLMQNLFPFKKDATPEKPNVSSSSQGDRISISLAAMKAQEFLNSEGIDEKDLAEMDLNKIDSLKQRGELLAQMLQMKINSFQSDFLTQMQSVGVNVEEAIDLQKGTDGNLQVMNNHPDLAKINQRLLQNKDWTKKFDEITKMAGLTEVLSSVQEESKGFNPFASIAALYAKQSQNSNNITAKLPNGQFQLEISKADASYTFN